MIINLPKDLERDTTHRYGPNTFKLHRRAALPTPPCALPPSKQAPLTAQCACGRLPTPRPGQVLGLVGTNGIGKSTALKILAGKLKPNLGRFDVRTSSRLWLHP